MFVLAMAMTMVFCIALGVMTGHQWTDYTSRRRCKCVYVKESGSFIFWDDQHCKRRHRAEGMLFGIIFPLTVVVIEPCVRKYQNRKIDQELKATGTPYCIKRTKLSGPDAGRVTHDTQWLHAKGRKWNC